MYWAKTISNVCGSTSSISSFSLCYIHNEIIDEAFPGLSKSQLQSLKTASANVDKDQSPEGSYKHGMGNGDAVNNTTTPGDAA